jgi:hypothetical protein
VIVSDLLERNVAAMKDQFPQFKCERGAAGSLSWRGIVQPIRTDRQLTELLFDIANDRAVRVLRGGVVEHEPQCGLAHKRLEWMARLSNPFVVYRLKVNYNGGRAHPRCYVLSPRLTKKGQPHVYVDGAICPFPPWQDVWRSTRNTVVDYLDHSMIWLIKQTIWNQTALWIGSEMRHDMAFLERVVGRNQPCWCGSGNKRKNCKHGVGR